MLPAGSLGTLKTEYRAYIRGVERHQRSDPVREITGGTVREGLRSRVFQRRLPGHRRSFCWSRAPTCCASPPASARTSPACAASTFRSWPARPRARASAGRPFATSKVIVSNDFLNDARSLAWREGASAGQVGAAAALPLICNGHSVGVLLVTRREPGSINRQIVSMLERMSANISFALDNFDHEAARKDGERAMRRLNRMFGAISATNEAILRAKTEQELYQRVCDAAVHSGKSVATAVLLAEPGSIWLKPVAGTGESLHLITRVALLDRSRQRIWQGHLRRGVPDAAALRQRRSGQHRAGRALAGGAARDRRDGLRRRSPDQGRPEHRRAAVLCQQILGGGRGDHRAAGADRGERLVRARQFRARRAKRPGRPAEGAADADVRGAQRHQRSDHAGEVPHRTA